MDLQSIIIPVVGVGSLAVFGGAFWSRYKTVGPETAMIITGSFLGNKNVFTDKEGHRIKIVKGGGAFILPIFQRVETMPLCNFKLEIRTPEVFTSAGVPIIAQAVAIIKIGSTIEDIAIASEQFMNMPFSEAATEVLEGHLRAILGNMTVETAYRDREAFAQQVQQVAAIDLKKMGLQIISLTIKDVNDERGYLEALGRPRIATVKRDAEVAEAEAFRDARVRKALADEEGAKAELLRDTNVAEASKDKEIKIASFKKVQDTAKAEADLAYSIQEAKAKQLVTEEEMKVQIVKKDKEIELQAKDILQKEREYDANIKKKADAEKYAIEQKAEADKVTQIKTAEANAEKTRIEGIAAADAIKAKGNAEAEVIKATSKAEAEGKEALAKAFELFGKAAILDAYLKVLPLIAKETATAFGSIDKITVVDAGGNSENGGAMKVSNYLTNLLATAPQMVKESTGIDFVEMMKSIVDNKIAPTDSQTTKTETSAE